MRMSWWNVNGERMGATSSSFRLITWWMTHFDCGRFVCWELSHKCSNSNLTLSIYCTLQSWIISCFLEIIVVLVARRAEAWVGVRVGVKGVNAPRLGARGGGGAGVRAGHYETSKKGERKWIYCTTHTKKEWELSPSDHKKLTQTTSHIIFLVRSDLVWPGLVLSCLVLSCLVLSCLVWSCLVLSCLVLPCLVLSCLVLSCLVLPCPVLSCLVLSCDKPRRSIRIQPRHSEGRRQDKG